MEACGRKPRRCPEATRSRIGSADPDVLTSGEAARSTYPGIRSASVCACGQRYRGTRRSLSKPWWPTAWRTEGGSLRRSRRAFPRNAGTCWSRWAGYTASTPKQGIAA
jgi:hypothetical protein